jgi:hypothetical protein
LQQLYSSQESFSIAAGTDQLLVSLRRNQMRNFSRRRSCIAAQDWELMNMALAVVKEFVVIVAATAAAEEEAAAGRGV